MTKETIIIKASDMKVAIGHQPHVTGTGVHKDKRTKRNRTRSDQKRRILKEYENKS